MHRRYFSNKIVKWYENHRRKLPWRETSDPYKIWLSEIMLQQTRVSQGLPYYLQFIEQYPTVMRLASAPLRQVLRLWQGLGYYTRARNLHKCAKMVAQSLNGQFPASYDQLLKLPGIGEYTAAAIASFSFRIPVAVVDGNVFRLLSRLFGIEEPINSTAGKKEFGKLANRLIPEKRPDLHNQAIMEFGALVCTPVNPDCGRCIFQNDCFAFKHSLQSALPVKLKIKPARKRYFYYLVLQHGNSLLMRKRDARDIWMGLFDFQLIEKPVPCNVEKLLHEEPLQTLVRDAKEIWISGLYKHTLSHQTIFTKFVVAKTEKKIVPVEKNHFFYSLKEIARLPKPVLVSRFLTDQYLS